MLTELILQESLSLGRMSSGRAEVPLSDEPRSLQFRFGVCCI